VNLTVLGGSAAGPNTGMGCAGFLVQHDQSSIVLDLGPDTLLELRKHVDVRDLSAIVISHYHLDHVLDLGALRYLLAYGPATPSRKIDLLIPPGTLALFALWGRTFGHETEIGFWDDYFAIKEYDPKRGIPLPGLTISLAPTVHPAQGWAMRVTADSGEVLGYTADTGPTADLAGRFRDVDLLIAEATEGAEDGNDDPSRGHLTAQEAGELAMEAGAKRLLLTHMWQENGIEAAIERAAEAFSGPIMAAQPGLNITL
jgi:ribonuclease BN (tRNA processing enzyme)